MSRTTTESKDGVFCNDQIESPLMDEGNSGGNDGGLVLKKGPWTSAEDAILVDYVKKHGEGNWNSVQKHSGLFRCGKSCRLRWANHLRPNLKKGAFTQEEERLIIELHAKMGNKWARMAAHLPGRTDNEIKNYWNTRIKRRQRAGLPLYPPELSLQAMQESQQDQNTTETNAGDRGHQSLFQSNSYEIPDVIFDSLKVNQGVLPYVPDISSTSMLMKHLGSPQYCTFTPATLHRQKRLRESTSMFSGYNEGIRNCFPLYDQLQDDAGDLSAQSCGLPFPVDPDLDDANKNSLSFGVIQGGHSLSNGNFSASKPTCEAVKLELPSLQHSETALSSWAASSPLPALDSVDAFIQSPPSGDFDSGCVSPRNSGLLDALLHEAKTLSSAKHHSSDKSSNSSSVNPGDVAAESSHLNASETEWQDYDDPISPLGHSSTSLFSECTPLSATGSSLDEHPVEGFTGSNMKSDSVTETWPSDRQKETTTQLYSDSLLASDWFEQNTEDQATMTDAIAALLGDDLGSEYMHITTGTSHSGQGWGFGSCAWNNMPAVCQTSEIP